MSLHNIISNGGTVLIAGGHLNSQLSTKYTEHPQLIFWSGDRNKMMQNVQNRGIPDNCRAILLSRFISHETSSELIKEARKRQMVLFAPSNDGEIRRILDDILTIPVISTQNESTQNESTQNKTKQNGEIKMEQGAVKSFVEQNSKADLIPSQEGKRLFALAKEKGIKTTEGSLIQAVRVFRKQYGISAPVGRKTHKVKKETKREMTAQSNDDLLNMVEELENWLALLKDEVKKFSHQTDEYNKLKAKLADLIK